MGEEIWKKIDGCSYYEVSNYGRVKSLPRKVKRGGCCKTEMIMNPSISPTGKLLVGFVKDSGQKTSLNVAKIVYNAFIGGAGSRDYVYYKDGNFLNVRLDNLTLDRKYSKRRKPKRLADREPIKLDKEHHSCFKKLWSNRLLTALSVAEYFQMTTLDCERLAETLGLPKEKPRLTK